jgi:uncharacterized protein (DUF433 family)
MAERAGKRSVAFRFGDELLEQLRRRATESGASQTALAERYIAEGLRQDEHPLIGFRDGAAGRRAVLLGSRLSVADVITTIRQNENSVEAAADYLEVPVEQVEAALRYYADFEAEVDERIARSAQIAERERQLWERRRAALS